MFDGAEYSYSCEDEVLSRCRNNKKTKGKSGVNNKRRFSDEQIKSLESMFESETRLEPRKKLQLASELGLQPRQVAIWFQNKRARWKSKQLERDYSILLANYNSLASRFESLKKDKHALLLHLQKLNNDVKQGQAVREEEGFEAMKPSLSVEKYERDVGEDAEAGVVNFDVNNNNNNSSEPADSSLTSPDEWDGLNSKALFDESTSGYDQWWDFWS